MKNIRDFLVRVPVRVDVLPETAVGMCDNCEKNFPQNFFNEIINSKFAKYKREGT